MKDCKFRQMTTSDRRSAHFYYFITTLARPNKQGVWNESLTYNLGRPNFHGRLCQVHRWKLETVYHRDL